MNLRSVLGSLAQCSAYLTLSLYFAGSCQSVSALPQSVSAKGQHSRLTTEVTPAGHCFPQDVMWRPPSPRDDPLAARSMQHFSVTLAKVVDFSEHLV